jgi:hypothetical protein
MTASGSNGVKAEWSGWHKVQLQVCCVEKMHVGSAYTSPPLARYITGRRAVVQKELSSLVQNASHTKGRKKREGARRRDSREQPPTVHVDGMSSLENQSAIEFIKRQFSFWRLASDMQ